MTNTPETLQMLITNISNPNHTIYESGMEHVLAWELDRKQLKILGRVLFAGQSWLTSQKADANSRRKAVDNLIAAITAAREEKE